LFEVGALRPADLGVAGEDLGDAAVNPPLLFRVLHTGSAGRAMVGGPFDGRDGRGIDMMAVRLSRTYGIRTRELRNLLRVSAVSQISGPRLYSIQFCQPNIALPGARNDVPIVNCLPLREVPSRGVPTMSRVERCCGFEISRVEVRRCRGGLLTNGAIMML